MKKFSRLLFVLLLTSCLLTPSYLLAKENSDNNEKIETLQKAGIITGYPDGSLGLDKPITRAEIAVILTKRQPNKKSTGHLCYCWISRWILQAF